jgi:hypothetical protein
MTSDIFEKFPDIQIHLLNNAPVIGIFLKNFSSSTIVTNIET